MRILYIITTTDLGGAEKSLLDVIKNISVSNSVKVISLKPIGYIGNKIKEIKNVEIISLNMVGNLNIGTIIKLRKEIKNYKPDIVHSMLYRGIEYTRIACLFNDVPLFTTFHCDLSKKNFFTRLVDKILRFKDFYTLAESQNTFEYLRNKQKYSDRRLKLVYNSVDEKEFFKDELVRNNIRERYNFSDKDIVFGCISRIHPVKNLLTVCNAFNIILRNNKNIYLVLVGDGEYKKVILDFIEMNNLKNKIKLVGSQENVNEWLNLIDVFVQYSVEESLPLSLLEAIKVGKPCIVSNVGDMPKWVIHGKNGYVGTTYDPVLLSCFMTELCNKNLINNMGKKSLEIAKNIKDTSKEYLKLYKQFSRENK